MSYLGPDILSALESKIIDKQGELEAWFAEKRSELTMPIYGSVDICDAHWKVAGVDAIQYPAGFHNLNDGEIGAHLREAIGDLRPIPLLPDAPSRNPGYP